eukprot:Tbor_TRINITY_DN6737_c0_g1::TRINITY_DN6737_c0_g1_i1::g.15365::m.15365
MGDAFLLAVRSSDACVKEMMDKDENLVDATDEQGNTCLHIAAGSQDTLLCKILLSGSKKPKMDAKNGFGLTPLMIACKAKVPGCDPFALIKSLVDAGASLEATVGTDGALTASHLAMQDGDIETASYLMSIGANTTHHSNPAGSLLHLAVYTGNTTTVGYTIAILKTLIDVKDAEGYTPLQRALLANRIDIVQLLLEQGADVNIPIEKTKDTPLHIVANQMTLTEARLLIAFDANVSLKNNDNLTPLQVAEKAGDSQKPVAKELAKPAKTIDTRKEDAARFKAHGNRVFAGGENAKAAKFYSQAILNDAKNHIYFSNRAACYFNLKMYDAAYFDSCRCVVLCPDWAKGYFRKAATEHALSNTAASMKTIEKGLKLDPKNKDLLTLRDAVKAMNRK